MLYLIFVELIFTFLIEFLILKKHRPITYWTYIAWKHDFLNDRLQEGFLHRIHAMKPYEAYSLIFSWDNIVVNS